MSAPKTTLERELKLVVWPEFVVPDLAGTIKDGGAGRPVRRKLEAIYYDTEDLRLLRQGITLRRRRGDAGGPQWTLKLPKVASGPGLARSEISLPARGPLPRHLHDLVLGWALGAEVTPVAEMVTERTSVALTAASGAALVSIDDDDVMVERSGHVVARFRELEIELLPDAPGKLLSTVAKRLQGAGAQPASQVPKLVRALGPEAVAPPPLSSADSGEPEGTAAALTDRLVTVLRDGIVAQHAPLVLGEGAAARSMRDATETFAITLRAFAPILADRVVHQASRELEWLESQLSTPLALEDLHAELRPDRSRQGRAIAAAAAAALEAAVARRARALRSRRYRRLLAELEALASDPPVARRMRGRSLAKIRRRCTDPAMASARAAVGGRDRLAGADLREALERLSCLLPPGHPASRDLERLTAMLREAADHSMAARALQQLSAPGTDWARGVLAGRHQQQADVLTDAAMRLWNSPKRASRWADLE